MIAIGVTGCVDTGDFGRPRNSVWNSAILPTSGSVAASLHGEPASWFAYTDDERELRDRAWRFLMPAHERSTFASVLADLTRNRVLPRDIHPASREEYYRALISGRFRSPASRYRRLSEDVTADLKLMTPFATVGARVIATDDVRLRSLAYVTYVNPVDTGAAVARVAENRCLMAWVRDETEERLESYRYALEQLVIEMPQTEAVPTERALTELAAHRQVLDGVAPPMGAALCASPAELRIAAYAVPAPVAGAAGGPPIVAKD